MSNETIKLQLKSQPLICTLCVALVTKKKYFVLKISALMLLTGHCGRSYINLRLPRKLYCIHCCSLTEMQSSFSCITNDNLTFAALKTKWGIKSIKRMVGKAYFRPKSLEHIKKVLTEQEIKMRCAAWWITEKYVSPPT